LSSHIDVENEIKTDPYALPDMYSHQRKEAPMKKISLAILVSLCTFSAATFAQDSSSGVTVSTDPAKASAIEQHAQELQAQQQNGAASQAATGAASDGTAPARHTRHHAKKHAAKAAKNTNANTDAPAADGAASQ
jgi:hypothetical protein